MLDRIRKAVTGEEPLAHPLQAPAYDDWQRRVDEEYAKLEPYPEIELPPYSGEGKCPKCGSRALTTHYFAGGHVGCVDGRIDTRMLSFGFSYSLPEPETAARTRRALDRHPEHHDRTCFNCKHGWAEGLVAAD